MSPLEKLFRLEIEFHRRLRTAVPGTGDARSLHTSFALQTGYESLIAAAGTVTVPEIERLRQRLFLIADPRDILAAREFLMQVLTISAVTA